jgi:hypothetical protein
VGIGPARIPHAGDYVYLVQHLREFRQLSNNLALPSRTPLAQVGSLLAQVLSSNSTNSFRIHWRVLSSRTEQRELEKEVPEIDQLEGLAQKASA